MITLPKHSAVLFALVLTAIWSGCDSPTGNSPEATAPPVKAHDSPRIPKYSVEETVQFMFMNVPAYKEIEQGDPLAVPEIFELIQDPRCLREHWIGFAIVGVLADDSQTPRIVQWLKSRKGELEPFEIRATEHAFRALARMRARGLPNASAAIEKMLDPGYWDESFRWEKDPEYPVRYDTAFRVLAACVHQADYSALRKKLMDRAENEQDHRWLDWVVKYTLNPVEDPPKRQNPETAGTPNYDRIHLRAAAKWRPWHERDPSHGSSPPVAQNTTETPPLATAHETTVAGDAQAELVQQALAAFAEIRREICREEPVDVDRLLKLRTKFLRKDGPLREPKNDQEKIRGTQWMKLQRELLQLLETENLTPQTPPFLCTSTTEKVEDRSIEVIRIGFRLPGSLKLFGASQSWPELSRGASRGTKSMEFGPNSTETRPIWGDFIIYMQRRDGEWLWLPFNS